MSLKTLLKHGASLAILIAFMLAVEYFVGWRSLLAPWRDVPLTTLLFTVLLAFTSYWIRSHRFYDYFRPQMHNNYALCFKLMLQHNLLNNLLPMRTGELSFPLLMARYFTVPASQSIPALFWFRILDLHALGAIALLAAGAYWLGQIPAMLLTLAWLPLPWLLYRGQHYLQTRYAHHQTSAWQQLLHKLLSSLPQTPAALWRSWLWTLINWIIKLAVFAWVISLFASVPWAAAWLGAISGDLTSVLPVHGIAGAGTYEAGVVAGMMLLQTPLNVALPAAVNLHLFILASTLIGGLLSLTIKGNQAHG